MEFVRGFGSILRSGWRASPWRMLVVCTLMLLEYVSWPLAPARSSCWATSTSPARSPGWRRGGGRWPRPRPNPPTARRSGCPTG